MKPLREIRTAGHILNHTHRDRRGGLAKLYKQEMKPNAMQLS